MGKDTVLLPGFPPGEHGKFIFSFWRLWQGSPTAFRWGNTDTPFPWHPAVCDLESPNLTQVMVSVGGIQSLPLNLAREGTGGQELLMVCSALPIFPLLASSKLTKSLDITYPRFVNWGSLNKFSKQFQIMEFFFLKQGSIQFRPKSKKKKEIKKGNKWNPPKPKPKPKINNPHYCYLAYFMLVLKFNI